MEIKLFNNKVLKKIIQNLFHLVRKIEIKLFIEKFKEKMIVKVRMITCGIKMLLKRTQIFKPKNNSKFNNSNLILQRLYRKTLSKQNSSNNCQQQDNSAFDYQNHKSTGTATKKIVNHTNSHQEINKSNVKTPNLEQKVAYLVELFP